MMTIDQYIISGITEEQLERDYAKYLLGDCTSWLKARMKRKNAKPVILIIVDRNNIDLTQVQATLSIDSPDEIMSWLFKASISNRIIKSACYDQHYIYLYVQTDKDTNISLSVMETILSWFNLQNQKVNDNGGNYK